MPRLLQHGLDLKQLDVAVVLKVVILSEGSRNKIPYLWLPIIATLLLGPSFGFPLFLLFRYLHFEKISAVASLDDHANG